MELHMIMMIDTMAERYKLLPSEVLNRASTFDLYVLDAAVSYQNHQHKKQSGKVAEDYSQDELMDMIKKTRE